MWGTPEGFEFRVSDLRFRGCSLFYGFRLRASGCRVWVKPRAMHNPRLQKQAPEQ